MSSLAKLKLVSVQQDRRNPIFLRRSKLTSQLEDQIASAKAASGGAVFVAHRQKSVRDKQTGERVQVEISRKVRQWWFTTQSGKIALALRYGAKPLELSKGKNAIEVANMDELIATLELVKLAVQAGELDTQLEQVGGALREGFKRKK